MASKSIYANYINDLIKWSSDPIFMYFTNLFKIHHYNICIIGNKVDLSTIPKKTQANIQTNN